MKLDVINAIRQVLQTELHALVRANELARDEATNNKPENKYDTRALEASYLASAQVDRMVDLQQLIGFYDRIEPHPSDRVQVGALIELQDERDDESHWVFMAPRGGGNRVTVEGKSITVLSASSPLGKALTGLRAEDEARFETPQGPRNVEILAIR